MDRPDAPPRQLWAEFLFSRVLVFVVARENYGDIHSYFAGASRLALKGTPYGEDGFGYPVLAFLFVAIPWLFGGTKFDLYYPIYRAQCFATDVLLFYILSRRCSRSSLIVYILSTALLSNLLYNRLDIFLGLLLTATLILEARGAPRLASFVLGASIAFKVIPIFLLPAWLLWHLRRSLKDAFGTSGFMALGAGGPMAIAYLLWGMDALFFMGTHAGRGIQIESLWASIEIALMNLGNLEGKTYFSAGSYNLSTPLEGMFTSLSHIGAVGAAFWGGFLALRLARSRGPLVLAMSSTLGALILVSKVFSPQYLLFFFPLLVWSFETMTPRARQLTIALTIITSILTTWVYPYHEKDLVALSAIATVPLIARNAVFSLLVVLLQIHAWRSGRRESRRTSFEGMEAARAEKAL